MKIKSFIIFILLLTVNTLTGQTLKENKVDDFTNNSVKRTSWETLNYNSKFSAYFRISKINESCYLDLKFSNNSMKVFSVDKGNELMFKLENDKIIKLLNLKYTISDRGVAAKGIVGSDLHGVLISYLIDKEQIQSIKSNIIVKTRIYTNESYVESDMKTKNYNKIKKALQLVD